MIWLPTWSKLCKINPPFCGFVLFERVFFRRNRKLLKAHASCFGVYLRLNSVLHRYAIKIFYFFNRFHILPILV
jgi:hypothetical protein